MSTVPIPPLVAAEVGASMKDEYGAMDSSGFTFSVTDFRLESGEELALAEVSILFHACSAY